MATLKEWSTPGVFEVAKEVTEQLVAALIETSKVHSVPLVAQSVGTMFGFFFSESEVASFRDTQNTNRQAFNTFFHAMLKAGVYFAPSAFEAGFVSVAHKGAALEHTCAALAVGFGELG